MVFCWGTAFIGAGGTGCTKGAGGRGDTCGKVAMRACGEGHRSSSARANIGQHAWGVDTTAGASSSCSISMNACMAVCNWTAGVGAKMLCKIVAPTGRAAGAVTAGVTAVVATMMAAGTVAA